MSKLNNNLYKVEWQGKIYWFTKADYIRRLTGIQSAYIQKAMYDPDYAKKRGVKISIEDGSEVKYKDINNLDAKIN